MKTSQKISKMENRPERVEYSGVFKDFQTFGSTHKGKRYANTYERDPYNMYQNSLYKRALFGFKMYTQEEIKLMSKGTRQRITKTHARAQAELNIWKQERIIAMTNKLLSIFRNSPIVQPMINLYSEPDPKFISRTSFKELGITKDAIIERLCSKGILPHNFNTLK